jgi:TatD DNase family protein
VWVDAHCHLQLELDETRFDAPKASPSTAGGPSAREPGPERPLRAEDLYADAQVKRARDAGIEWMVCVGTGLETSQQATDLAARYDDVYATVGLHPHDASELDKEWDGLVALASGERCVAIGEAGFDLHYEHSPRDEQEVAFRRQIQLAKQVNRPLMIHSRNAWDDTFRLLDEEGVPERTIFHCFTGGPDEARLALDRDCYLSFSGIVSFKTADDIRAAAALAPADRMLVETDSPYLAPVPHRGKPNEPAFVPLVGAALAAARDVDVREIAEVTRANSARVFGVAR